MCSCPESWTYANCAQRCAHQDAALGDAIQAARELETRCSEPEMSSYEQQEVAGYEAAAQRRAAHSPLVGLNDSVLSAQQQAALNTAANLLKDVGFDGHHLNPAQARTLAIYAVDAYLREMRKIED